MNYGRWTVVGDAPNDKHGIRRYLCKCSCGTERAVSRYHVASGRSRSCGCLTKEVAKDFFTTHGQIQTKTYRIWCEMKQRCSNKSAKAYRWYGAKGITACRRWLAFKSFLEDMGQCPPGYSIERIDNKKGYGPKNCKWIPLRDQGKNKSNTRWITANGETKSMAEWARTLNLNPGTLSNRVRKGLSDDQIINRPIYRGKCGK